MIRGSKNLSNYLSKTVGEYIRQFNVKGDKFGVEIELEGKGVKYDPDKNRVALKFWAPMNDPSLRELHGEAQEWVFNKPQALAASKDSVNLLFLCLEDADIFPSQRTSVHVHYNMSDKKIYQVYNTYILFTIFEDILAKYCGEERQGNLNCLESRKATYILRMVEDSLRYGNFNDFSKDFRYASLSLCSLNKFGTVEFRGMRGLDNAEDVNKWLDIINDLTQYSCYKMGDPMSLMNEISMETPIKFMEKVFSPLSFNLLSSGLSENEITQSVYEGLRLVQHMASSISSVWERVIPYGVEDWWYPEEKKEVDDPRVFPNFIDERNEEDAQPF